MKKLKTKSQTNINLARIGLVYWFKNIKKNIIKNIKVITLILEIEIIATLKDGLMKNG